MFLLQPRRAAGRMSEVVRAFGTWDAPMTDDAVWLDTVPPGLVCMSCEEAIVEGENGAIMPTGFATHRECALRSALGGIGHLVDHGFYCRGELGPDAGLSYRLSALLVWEWHHGRRYSRVDLELRRRMEERGVSRSVFEP